MQRAFSRRLPFWLSIATLVCTWPLQADADPIPVRHVQGTFHGFLELRSEGGVVVASGDATQVVHGDRITAETIFRFKDGSVDDEVTVYSQHRTLQLISDHRIQKGPSFPHPMDMTIDARSGEVTVRTTGKDGKEEVKTEHLNLPPDLANGMIPLAIENLRSASAGTTLSMIVATPKPRLVKLEVSPAGADTCSVMGSPRKANHYEIKIDLGGVAGVVAPLIGKAPPTIHVWAIQGDAPTFIREEGPLYSEGPMMTIQLASPSWQNPTKSGE